MDNQTPMSHGSVPPYEATQPQYPQQPAPMQHTGSYGSALGQPMSQDPYHTQQPAISPPAQTYAQHPQAMANPPIETQKSEYYSGPQPTGQAPQQMQPATTQSTFQTAIPLASLQKAPAPIDCPICHTRTMTRTEYHSGNTTHLWAIVCGCCLCLCCVPYFVRATKDVEHKCGHCGGMLATHKNSGTTEVHAYA